MSRYATKTQVSADRSRVEIEKTLTRYGADQFIYGWEIGRAIIGFRMHGIMIRITLPMPRKDDEAFTKTPAGRRTRNTAASLKAWEQATRQRWRALALVVKAKLEAVESGIATFEDEFLAYVQLPNGATVGEWARPQIETAYKTGRMPALLPGSVE